MTKRVKYTATCKEWKLINSFFFTHGVLVRFEFLMPTFLQLFAMRFMIIQLEIESDAFCASGLVVMGFLLWEEGSGKQDLRVVEG